MRRAWATRPISPGFTLLEMLLVVFILSALAMTATAFVQNQDDQFRFEDTRRRLETVRRAVIGDVNGGNGTVVAGYVADNGVLSTALGDLLAVKPMSFADSVAVQPVFDATPSASTGLDDGVGAVSLTGEAERMTKGWRAGYLHTQAGASGSFKDGWGFDWSLAVAAGTLSVTSRGKDNAPGGSGYGADVSDTVAAADWSGPITGLTVRIRNQSGTDYAAAGPARLRASLLAFENTTGGAKWKRYTTDGATCLDGTGDGLVGGMPCAAEATLTFPAGGYPGGTYTSVRVPLGRHLLLLVNDADGSPHTSDDVPHPSSVAPVSRQILCTAAGCPIETLFLK